MCNLSAFAVSSFTHDYLQIEKQRTIFNQRLDSAMLEFGITAQNVKDPEMTACCLKLEKEILEGQNKFRMKDSLFPVMRDFLQSQLESFAGLKHNNVLPPLPRKSSIRQKHQNKIPKNVKIDEQENLRKKPLKVRVPKLNGMTFWDMQKTYSPIDTPSEFEAIDTAPSTATTQMTMPESPNFDS
jgi:hypothetical protein